MWLRYIIQGAILVIIFIAVSARAEALVSHTPVSKDETVRELAKEVCGKGWIVFCARSEKGDWDLFLCRPDGSKLFNITNTTQYNETAPQFSRDGRKLLCRRLPRAEQIDGNQYGTQGQLVFADSDGTNIDVFGKSGEYSWASWSPDGRQIACLSTKGIFFVDIANRKTTRKFDRNGFFQQLTWSPDGKWLCGVSNSFGTGWSVARIDAVTGLANAVSRIDCCTPDWFSDSKHLVFSNRPPGQQTNNEHGWTQLWMADGQAKTRRLLYAEEGRHIYGGHISPNDKYVLFTGNMQEDGDPGNKGAPMALMRISDAPVVGGRSKQLRTKYPKAKRGPVLELPVGWEPCWTFAEIVMDTKDVETQQEGENMRTVPETTIYKKSESSELVDELRGKGWIIFSAETDKGNWDLFLMHPDGTNRRQITNTRKYNEAGARFSPDGQKLLYFRMPNTEQIDNNTYGTYELVIADADGSNTEVYGNNFQWASWAPDGNQIACLDKKGIRIIDLDSRRVLRSMPRKGIVQQLVWSPDGKWFAGTANGLGIAWAIGRLDADTGQINVVSETDRYNCTPDWLGDSQHIIYSRGIVPDTPGWAQLWLADGNGQDKQLLYAEQGRHIYGGCVSPDGKYILFTRSEEDLGKVHNSQTRMAIIRWKDTPMVGGDIESLRAEYPNALRGPVLDLSWGWEPHWTYNDAISSHEIDMTTRRARGFNQ